MNQINIKEKSREDEKRDVDIDSPYGRNSPNNLNSPNGPIDSLLDNTCIHGTSETLETLETLGTNGPNDANTIKADLQRADEESRQREEHFKTPGKLTCYKAKLRAYAITEYGIYGWVDPLKLSSVIGLPVCLVCHGLDHLKYHRYERQGGGIGYTQKAVTAGRPIRETR